MRVAVDWLNRLGPFLGVLAIFIAFSIARPKTFCNIDTVETIARQTAKVGAAAIGMTMVIVLGGIDLSVGSMVGFTAAVMAVLLRSEVPPSVAIAAGLATGAVLGAINGVLITQLKQMPFIVTLGTMGSLRGFTEVITSGNTINFSDKLWVARFLEPVDATMSMTPKFMIFPWGVWAVIAIALLAAGTMRYTQFGRHIVAVGSNELTAQLCGVPVNRVKVYTYALMGVSAALGGLMLAAFQGQGDPTGGIGLELDVIAAVVIGGGSLAGGQGSIFGSLAGALIMTEISVGGSRMGWPTPWQKVLTGFIIIIAVALDTWRRRAATR